MNRVLIEILDADGHTTHAYFASSPDECLGRYAESCYRTVSNSPALGVAIFFGKTHKLTPLPPLK